MREGASPGLGRGSRALSITVDYTLTLVIATLVVTSLFVTANAYVSEQREEVVRTELEVVGQHVASDVARTDRLAQAGTGADAAVINASLPDRVSGSEYTLDVSSTGWINLTTQSPDITVSIRVDTQTPLRDGAVTGGDLAVVFDAPDDKLEVVS